MLNKIFKAVVLFSVVMLVTKGMFAATYPTSLDTKYQNGQGGATLAIETELGLSPKGNYASVKARLDQVETNISTNGVADAAADSVLQANICNSSPTVKIAVDAEIASTNMAILALIATTTGQFNINFSSPSDQGATKLWPTDSTMTVTKIYAQSALAITVATCTISASTISGVFIGTMTITAGNKISNVLSTGQNVARDDGLSFTASSVVSAAVHTKYYMSTGQ